MSGENRSTEDYIQEIRAVTHGYAKDLLKEYEKLLSVSLSLRAEKARLEAHIQSLEVDLKRSTEAYTELVEQITDTEASENTFCSRYVEVEQSCAHLASLYVASHRIHASLDRERVLGAIQDVIINLIGSESFAIFERASESAPLTMAAFLGVDWVEAIRDASAHEVWTSGTMYVRPPSSDGPSTGPAICIPLKVGERMTGMIAIYSLLGHKLGLEPLDHELCNLLATHAGSALYSSFLYARAKVGESWQ